MSNGPVILRFEEVRFVTLIDVRGNRIGEFRVEEEWNGFLKLCHQQWGNVFVSETRGQMEVHKASPSFLVEHCLPKEDK